MTRSRTDRSTARRGLAVCALTGAALLTAVTGGTAWADGGSGKATPSQAPASATPSAPSAPAVEGAKTPSATPQPAAPAASAPAVAGAGAGTTPTATPVKPQTPGGTAPQVREVPKGAAQAGDGSGSAGDSGLMLVGGGTVAALGAGALGYAVLRRRSGARG
ncbi:hypothetical protein OG535_35270 [Kitasatospora sp. NBC_00085]|uniref:hypothetical protein n=1 Tax=unclassified Kitasatospora TaxID=2633591 RepID=UPI00324B7DAA